MEEDEDEDEDDRAEVEADDAEDVKDDEECVAEAVVVTSPVTSVCVSASTVCTRRRPVPPSTNANRLIGSTSPCCNCNTFNPNPAVHDCSFTHT